MKSLKTPLRYPGGKSRAIKYLLPKFPKDITEYREPFLGGGSVAIAFTKEYPDIPVWVNDLYNPLYTFWCILRDRSEELYEILKDAKEEHPTPDAARELFNRMKVEINHPESEDIYRAAAFYIINKCSFSGLTESSSFSAQASDHNFTMRGIENLPKYSELIHNWKITNFHYWEMMLTPAPVGTFWFLDPPYDIKDNLYGKKGSMHNGFNHDDFASDCDRYVGHQLVSYNSSNLVKERFDGWNASEFDLTYTMRSVGEYMREQKDRKELLLYNYGIEGLAELN